MLRDPNPAAQGGWVLGSRPAEAGGAGGQRQPLSHSSRDAFTADGLSPGFAAERIQRVCVREFHLGHISEQV